ncbi:uncharacterized protein [Miscanthus floridulus]|uniref:uncharacterized protein isoform X4 n=1 Tax=Miscanthus floridulus TaxID=154761 RepID=UPI003458512F
MATRPPGAGGAEQRWRGEAVTLWRGAANWAARDATGSARGPARRLMTSAHGLGSSMTWKPCQRKSRTERRKQHCIGRSKMQPTESKGCQDRFLLWISHMSTAVFAFNAMHHVEG